MTSSPTRRFLGRQVLRWCSATWLTKSRQYERERGLLKMTEVFGKEGWWEFTGVHLFTTCFERPVPRVNFMRFVGNFWHAAHE
jgi:hypothetical protein